MRRWLCLLLVLAIMFCSVGCDEVNGVVEEVSNNPITNAEKVMSDKEKYDAAIKLLEKNDYTHAIEYLEEIPNYNDAKALAGKAHYVYGSELFNEKDFTSAYTQFLDADGFSDISERKSMIDYYGGIYLTNNNKHVNALSYFKRALNSKYKNDATKHIEEISKEILYGVWIGDFTNDNGAKLEAHINYTNNGKFSVSYVDRANGYKVVTEFGGNLVVGAEHSVFVSGINFYKIKFDISSTNRMRITYADDSMLSKMLVNSYEKTAEWTPSYKISNVTYPTMTIPELFGDSQTEETETSESAENTTKGANDTGEKTTTNTTNSNEQQATKPPTTITTTKEMQHTHNYTLAATCEEPAKCECGATTGEAQGHKWVEATCEEPKTCEVCGKTSGWELYHWWVYATCEKPKTCQNCGKTEGAALGHRWEDATCETPKTCTVCKKTEGKALGHDLDGATCEEPDICKRCDMLESYEKGHDWEEATCTKARFCKTCGVTEGSPKGHYYNYNSYETVTGQYCVWCDALNPEYPDTSKIKCLAEERVDVIITNITLSDATYNRWDGSFYCDINFSCTVNENNYKSTFCFDICDANGIVKQETRYISGGYGPDESPTVTLTFSVPVSKDTVKIVIR